MRDERIYPDPSDGNYAFHLFRYLWALPYAYQREVLDAGCGSGYGADLLAAVARSVIAVDRDPDAIREARAKYAYRPNLTFETMDVTELPFVDESFDVIVSFEVFEHIEPSKSVWFVKHLARLCRPSGRVLLSTPNRLVEAPHLKSVAIQYHYHVNSVSPRELKARLVPYFGSVTLLGQRAKDRPLKKLLKAFDFLNLRHRLLSYSAKQRLDLLFSGGTASYGPDPNLFELSRWLVRQSGIIVAVCTK